MNNAQKLWVGVMLFFSIVMIGISVPYLSFKTDIGFLLTKQSFLHKRIWLYAFYVHVIASPMVLLAGVLQFVPYFIYQKPTWHRWAGKAYVYILLFFAAPSGLVLAIYANGGIVAQIGFTLLSLLWFYFTWMAFVKIRQKNIEAHRRMMYRSYALSMAAITLRLYTLVFFSFFHMHGKDFYIMVAWISWVPNLVVVEVYLRNK